MESLKIYLLALGLPGLFLIALLDSAGAPLPGGADVVVMLLAWRHPSLFLAIALTAAVGSTIGCWVLFRIAQRGGELALRGLDPGKQRWVSERLHRNDIVAILFAMLSPPPLPSKVFVVAAGIARIRPERFVAAAFVGRLVRYLSEAYLAVRVGNKAVAVLRDRATLVLILLVAGLALLALGQYLWRGRRPLAVVELPHPDDQST
jgi:membrane protein YqaA with SNARE-associated domain